MDKQLDWIDKIFIINMKQSKDRLQKCVQQLNKFNIKYERFEAIDGKLLKEDQYEKISNICNYLLCNNQMKGCALSHLKLLEKMVKEDIKKALIFEDDFIIDEDSIKKIDSLKNFDKGVVRLSCLGPFCNYNVDEPIKSFLGVGLGAYLINNKDATKLYNKISKVIYHIDIQINIVSFFSGVDIYNFPCIKSDVKSSTIFNKSSFIYGLPMSDNLKFYSNHIIIAPFGYNVNAYNIISFILLIIGIIYWKNIFGKILIVIGLIGTINIFL
jgi:GR25 family glycosyltransferase involved in LPS biosynthesis